MREPKSVPLEVLLAHRPFVAALARALARHGPDADDLEQRGWVAAVERPPRPGGSIRAWFARVLRNARRDAWRSEARRARREASTPPGAPVEAPDTIVARAEIHRRVVLAVFALEEPHRSTILLRFFDDLPAAEIARRQGVPAATVRKRLERALERLRDALDSEHHGDRRTWLVALEPVAGSVGGGHGAAGDAAPDAREIGRGALRSTTAHRFDPRPAVRRSLARGVLVAGALVAAVVAVTRGTHEDGAGSARDGGDATRQVGGGPDVASDAPRPRVAGARPPAPPTVPDRGGGTAPEAAPTRITVLLPDGDAAPGSAVRVFREPDARGGVLRRYAVELPPHEPIEEVRRAVTDAEGCTDLGGLRQGTYWLVAEAPGFAASEPLGVRLGDRSTSHTLVLRSAASLRGRVVDESTGRPTEAEVVALAARDPFGGPTSDVVRRSVRTAADGTFRIDAVPAGPVIVGARRPGGLFTAGTYVDVAGDSNVDLAIRPVAAVSGTTVEAVTRSPAGGIDVEAVVTAPFGAFSPARVRTRSDADGRFTIPDVPVGSGVVVLPTEGGPWKPAWDASSRLAEESQVRSLRAGGRADLLVPVVRAASVEGRIAFSDGSPAAGAEVVVVGDLRGPGSVTLGVALARTSAGTEGEYRLDGLDPGAAEVFARSGDEFAQIWSTPERRMASPPPAPVVDPRPVLIAGATTRIDVRLVRGARVSGRVLRADGTPAEGADVVTANRHHFGDFAAKTVSASGGRFLLVAVPPGPEPLVVHASLGGESGHARVADDGRDLVVRMEPPGALDVSISGRVVGPDGSAVAAARLLLVESPDADDLAPARFTRFLRRPGGRSVVVRRDGAFAVDRVPGRHRDRFLLVATARGFLPGAAMVPVRPGARVTDVLVALRAGDEIRGVLRAPDGTPVAGVPVRASPAPPGSRSAGDAPSAEETGPDGRFRLVVEPGSSVSIAFGAVGSEVLVLPSAPAGRDEVTAILPDGARTAPPVDDDRPDPRAGAPADWVRLVGRVTGADGEAVANAHVRHVSTGPGGRSSRGTSTDGAGRFSIALPPGAVGALEVDARERGVARHEPVAAGGGPVSIRVAPRSDPILAGVVRDARGSPVADAVVVCAWTPDGALRREYVDLTTDLGLVRDGWTHRSTRTDARGAYCFASLPPGAWTVHCGQPGTPWLATSLGTVSVTDPSQATTTRDLAVAPGRVLRARLVSRDGRTRRGSVVRIVAVHPSPVTPVDFHVTAAADGDGFLEVPGLPPGPWRVWLDDDATPVVVEESEEPVVLTR